MTKREMLSVRLDAETVKLLDRAEAAGLGSRSELVRDAIRRHLAAQAQPLHPLDVLGDRVGCFAGPRDLANRASEHVRDRIRQRHARPR